MNKDTFIRLGLEFFTEETKTDLLLGQTLGRDAITLGLGALYQQLERERIAIGLIREDARREYKKFNYGLIAGKTISQIRGLNRMMQNSREVIAAVNRQVGADIDY